MSVAPGTRFGPYTVIGPLGSGGMGEVYRARDDRLGRDVAVKVLRTEVAADAERIRRFEHEARAAGAFNHPQLITVFDTGVHEGAPYLVFELRRGRRRTGGRSREGDRPPRPEAREHLRDEGRTAQDPRLRPREAPTHS